MKQINKYILEKLVINKNSESEFSLQDCVIVVTGDKEVADYLKDHARPARINCAKRHLKSGSFINNHKYMYRKCYITLRKLLKNIKNLGINTGAYEIPARYDDIDQLIEGLEDCEYYLDELTVIKNIDEKLIINKDSKSDTDKNEINDILISIAENFLKELPELKNKTDAYEILPESDSQGDIPGTIHVTINNSYVNKKEFLDIYDKLKVEFKYKKYPVGWSAVDQDTYEITFSIDEF